MTRPTLRDLDLNAGKISHHRYVRHDAPTPEGWTDDGPCPGHHGHWSRMATLADAQQETLAMTPPDHIPAMRANGIENHPSPVENRSPSSAPVEKPFIIALSGPAGSGKSTAAEYLARRHGFARTRFAAPLKAMMGAFYSSLGFTAADIEARIEGDLKQADCPHLCGKTPRLAMQTLGTEWGREILGASFWVDAWRETAARVLDEGGKVVVEDCRFEDEAIAVRALGGIVIGLKGRGGIAGGHKSEAGVDADVTLWNDGPPEILHARLDGLIARFGREQIMAAQYNGGSTGFEPDPMPGMDPRQPAHAAFCR
jgi:hypothetical protein